MNDYARAEATSGPSGQTNMDAGLSRHALRVWWGTVDEHCALQLESAHAGQADAGKQRVILEAHGRAHPAAYIKQCIRGRD